MDRLALGGVDLANLQQAGHWGGADDGVARGN